MNGEERRWAQIVTLYPGWGDKRKFATLSQDAQSMCLALRRKTMPEHGVMMIIQMDEI